MLKVPVVPVPICTRFHFFSLQDYVREAAGDPSSPLSTMIYGVRPLRPRFFLLPSYEQRDCSGNLHKAKVLEDSGEGEGVLTTAGFLLTPEDQARCLLDLAVDPNVLGRAWRGSLPFI